MNALTRSLCSVTLLLPGLAALAQCPGVLPKFSWASDGPSIVFIDETDAFVTARVWDFGDGDSAGNAVETHTYTFAGDGTVTLTVMVEGCTFSTSARVVHPGQSDACYSQLSSAFTTEQTGNNELHFTDASVGDGSFLFYLWTFGDDSISLLQETAHFYTLPGAYNVSHSIGTVDSLFQTACVAGSARRVFVDGNTSTCDSSLFLDLTLAPNGNTVISSAQVVLFDPDLIITAWGWEYGDGSAMDITGMAEAQHDYPLGGEVQTCVQVWAMDTVSGDTCFARNCITLHLAALVGVEEKPVDQALRARPVPFNEELWIDGAAVRRGTRWRMIDALGREVAAGMLAHDTSARIAPGPLQSGVYTIILTDESRVYTLRLSKE